MDHPSRLDTRSLSTLGGAVLCVAAFLAVSGRQPRAQGHTFDLTSATIQDIHDAVDRRALTYERLVHLYLERVRAYDQDGPRLNAVIAVNPQAIDMARALDAERRATGRRGPLHGIPVAVKDNIDVRGMPTTGGNPAFAGLAVADDATVIRKLRDAGAIPLLKTNMDELALGTRGLSSHGGQIRNPFDLTRGPGGSSGGTAVAVNVAFAAVGLATETGFSIRSPASNNALVAIAPSRGLVSRAGVMPVSFTQDRVGVHARSVADAVLVLDMIRGFDVEDLSTALVLTQSPPPGSLAVVAAAPPPQTRVGVLRDLVRLGDEFAEGNAVVARMIDAWRARGATVVGDLTTALDLVALMPTLRVNGDELPTAFDGYLHRRGPTAPYPNFAAFVASGRFLQGTGLDARLASMMKAGPPETNSDYRGRLARQRQVQRALVDLMERERVDALVYPVKALPAPLIGTGDDGSRDNNISATAGLPAIVLPAGVTAAGLPIAIELLGRPFSEARLIALARAMELTSGARARPLSAPALPGNVLSY